MELEQLYQKYKECNGISTDTRRIAKNTIFFALKGENFNGNQFVQKALDGGAKYCVVDEVEAVINEDCILVKDTLKTLQDLARYHRESIGIPIIGLTGSNGKTTTKELIQSVLDTSFNVKATLGNLNNHIGVPLTLLTFSENLDFGIVEMGANHQKEIEFLSNIALPDYVLITNFGKAHLEGFGGVEGIIKGKSELYDFARQNTKHVFVNTNDHTQVQQIKGYNNVITFGSNLDNDFIIEFVHANPFVALKFNKTECNSHLIGNYNFQNIAVAVAIGQYFKVTDENIKKAIESYIPSNNRSQIIKKGTNQIILDAYNANPTSMMAALKNFLQLPNTNKFLFLGDMFELGESSENEHQAIADYAEKHFENNIFLVGEHFYKTRGNNAIKKFKNFNELKKILEKSSIENASVLIKASRGMALERLLEMI